MNEYENDIYDNRTGIYEIEFSKKTPAIISKSKRKRVNNIPKGDSWWDMTNDYKPWVENSNGGKKRKSLTGESGRERGKTKEK